MQKKFINMCVQDEIDRLKLSPPDLPVMNPVYYGQCAEDYLILSMLRALADREGINLSQHKYIEIGANHPVATSSSYLLYTGLGMTGILVDANPHLIEDLRRARPSDLVLNIAVSTSDQEYVDFYISDHSELSSLNPDFIVNFQHSNASIREVIRVPCTDINKLLQEHFPNTPPLFLSIDVEGMDADLIEHLNLSEMRPFLIQAESSIDWDPLNYSRILSKLTNNSYIILARTDVNLIAMDARRLGISLEKGSSDSSRREGAPLKLFQLSTNELRILISDADVLSLDIFDTILIRQCIHPTDVFGYIEKLRKIPKYQEMRIYAEKEARKTFRKSGGSETSIEEIYSILRSKIQIPNDMLEYELRTELDFLYPNPDALTAISIAKALGKRVIAISDIYLSSDRLKSLLMAKGVNVDEVYSSCDFREHDIGKYNTRIYRHACDKENVAPEKIIHIGDNYKSDFKNAVSMGVKAIHSHKLNRYLLGENPSLSRLMRISSSSTSNIVVGLLSKEAFLATDNMSHTERFGYQIAGPLLAGFLKFILDRSRKSKVSHLLLLARDGVIVEKALNIIKPTTMSWRTIPCSRRMAVFPLIANGNLDALSSLLKDKDAINTPKGLISRLSLEDHLSISGQSETPIGYSASLSALKDALIHQARAERDALLKLLQPELEAKARGKKFAWVDVGWALTSISALNEIIGEPAPGYFVGSHDRADDNPLLEGYLFERGSPDQVCRSVMSAAEVIELIFSDTTPSTAFVYQDERGQIQRHLQQVSSMERLRHSYISDVQTGALKFIQEVAPFFDGLDSHDLRKYNQSVFSELLKYPDKFLYETLSQVPHDRLAGASEWKTIGDYWKPRRFYEETVHHIEESSSRFSHKSRLRMHIEHKILSALSQCSPPLPDKMTQRFARSAKKRAKHLENPKY